MTPPLGVPVDAGGLPRALVARPQWVCWRYEERDGNWTKVPYNASTSLRASSTNPATWASCAEAVAAYQQGTYAGVGFVFSPSDPYTGIDLDKCRDPDSDTVAPWAREIITTMESYTEITPSATGVHILVEGTLPVGGRKKTTVEVYDRGRFFTMTGVRLPDTPPTIEPRQATLTDLLARVFGPPARPTGA